MRAVMISDLHLSGPDDPNQARLVTWLDGLEADVLFILGDLFHHWWGFDRAIPELYAPACEALLRLRARGVRLCYVPGNHDFALGPFFEEVLGAEIRPAHARSLDGEPYYLAHGDEADSSWGYRGLSLLLRGRAFRLLMHHLGPRRGMELLRKMAGTSRAYPAPSGPLLEAQRVWAQARVLEGARYVVLGHSHALGLTPLEGGALYNLGDWRDGPRWLEVQNGVPRLMPG